MNLTAPCYQCGEKAAVEGLCVACYETAHPLIEVRSPLTLHSCKRCDAVKVPGGWKPITGEPLNPSDLLQQQVRILLDHEVRRFFEDADIEFTEEKKLDRVLHIAVSTSGQSHKSIPGHTETYPVEVRMKYGTCDTCSMMSGGYHEAVLQIRADGRQVSESEEEEIMTIITDMTVADYGKDSKAYVSETTRTKHGIDLKIGSEHLCRQIADELESRYLAQRKENYKLIGQDRGGKRKYRITILIRLQRFTLNDFVRVDGSPCQVQSMGKGGLGCYDLQARQSFTINMKSSKWRTLEFISPESTKRQFMVVTKVYGQPVQLMDSKTFEMFEIDDESLFQDKKEGETVFGIILDDRVHLLP
ncbi:MAG: 60S ribosomal export protein NMD3 [Candidatus Hermodarchaeota archaeon]